jgi:hypothetical protein
MRRLYELTLALADGRLAPSEETELERLIAADPAAERRHLELLELEAALRASAADGGSERTVRGVLEQIERRRVFRRGLRAVHRQAPALLAGAALMVLAYLATEQVREAGGASSLVHGRRVDVDVAAAPRAARWSGGTRSPLRLRLASAAEVARLEVGGALVEARGPLFEGAVERERLVLDQGTVAVGEDGRPPITVATPHAEVTARGRHAVIAVRDGATEIDVHQGTALVAHRWGRTELGPGQGMRVGAAGIERTTSLPAVLLVTGSHFGRFPTDVLEGAVVRRLEGAGFMVQAVDEGALERRMLEGKALVVISPSASDLLGARIREVGLAEAAVPVVCARPSAYADLGMTTAGRGMGGFSGGATRVDVIQPDHPLAAGLAGPQQVTRAPGTLGWGFPGDEAVRVAVFPDWRKSERASIFAYERGSLLAGGTAHSPARRVGFFLHPDLGPYLTDVGWSLFDAAVRWAAAPPPRRR